MLHIANRRKHHFLGLSSLSFCFCNLQSLSRPMLSILSHLRYSWKFKTLSSDLRLLAHSRYWYNERRRVEGRILRRSLGVSVSSIHLDCGIHPLSAAIFVLLDAGLYSPTLESDFRPCRTQACYSHWPRGSGHQHVLLRTIAHLLGSRCEVKQHPS